MENTTPKWFTEDLHNMGGLITAYNWYKYGKITLQEFQSIFDSISKKASVQTRQAER